MTLLALGVIIGLGLAVLTVLACQLIYDRSKKDVVQHVERLADLTRQKAVIEPDKTAVDDWANSLPTQLLDDTDGDTDQTA